MAQTQDGSFPLFRVAGITVFLHWSWLVVAVIEYQLRSKSYTFPLWNFAEYLALFGIVLMHEFGHALACRQVGGIAEHIVLWPLGGIAYVMPPPRPGALLWSIAAGPLVNVVLVPPTVGLCVLGAATDFPELAPDFSRFVVAVTAINIGLLVFNVLPIYPLDGGQMLQAILWFVVGRVRSLQIASAIGLVGGLGLILLALKLGDWWLVIIAAFITLRAGAGFGQARLIQEREGWPRHLDAACPSCGAAPFQGEFWRCDQCGTPFDTFVHQALCPQCGTHFEQTSCPECHQRHPSAAWRKAVPADDTGPTVEHSS